MLPPEWTVTQGDTVNLCRCFTSLTCLHLAISIHAVSAQLLKSCFPELQRVGDVSAADCQVCCNRAQQSTTPLPKAGQVTCAQPLSQCLTSTSTCIGNLHMLVNTATKL